MREERILVYIPFAVEILGGEKENYLFVCGIIIRRVSRMFLEDVGDSANLGGDDLTRGNTRLQKKNYPHRKSHIN